MTDPTEKWMAKAHSLALLLPVIERTDAIAAALAEAYAEGREDGEIVGYRRGRDAREVDDLIAAIRAREQKP